MKGYPNLPPTAALLVKVLSGLVIQKIEGSVSVGIICMAVLYLNCTNNQMNCICTKLNK